jgi:hypothetical protein
MCRYVALRETPCSDSDTRPRAKTRKAVVSRFPVRPRERCDVRGVDELRALERVHELLYYDAEHERDDRDHDDYDRATTLRVLVHGGDRIGSPERQTIDLGLVVQATPAAFT